MAQLNLRVVGDAATATFLNARAAQLPARVRMTVGQWGLRLETQIKANASGRPGPRIITGHYRRSWTTQMTMVAGGAAAVVGTAAPQGRRLEYGFVGVDSLGRHYNQGPFPHVRPAMQQIEPGFVQAMRKILD